MSKQNQKTVKYTDPTKLEPKDPLKIRIMRKANNFYDEEYRKNSKITKDTKVNRWHKNDQAIIKSKKPKNQTLIFEGTNDGGILGGLFTDLQKVTPDGKTYCVDKKIITSNNLDLFKFI